MGHFVSTIFFLVLFLSCTLSKNFRHEDRSLASTATKAGKICLNTFLPKKFRKDSDERVIYAFIDDKEASLVKDEVKKIFNHLDSTDGRLISAKQYSETAAELVRYAKLHGITIGTTSNTIGVFPKGLYQIDLSGFSLKAGSNPGFIQLHELGHLFHTIHQRVTLVRALPKSMNIKSAEKYIKRIESGLNYNQFEKEVSRLSSGVHSFYKKGISKEEYLEKLNNLVDYSLIGLTNGRMKFPTKYTIEGVYASFLSKAPLVVGKGFGDLAARMSFVTFLSYYSLNMPFPFLPSKVKDKNGNEKRINGLRDFVNNLIL